ncbi:MAG: 50S ribosomal protein L32e [Candidatus Hodarchaeota archaeon]
MNSRDQHEKEQLELQRLLRIRRAKRQKKPKFIRAESWRYKRVKPNWRRARGLDSRTRQKKKGWPKSVSIGYGSPRKTRHLHPSGKKEILIRSVTDLETIDPELQIARIIGTVGRARREEILEMSRILGIRVANPLYVEQEISELETIELEDIELDEGELDLEDLEDLDLESEEETGNEED